MLGLMLPLLLACHEPIAESPNYSQEPGRQAPLSFSSAKFDYYWDRIIPLDMSVDELRVKTIFFNKREIAKTFLKGAQFGTRAQVEVENTSNQPKNPGFAVAVFDANHNLIGVATGGTKVGVVRPGKTEKFDLSFFQVTERLQRGAYFHISVELVK
ncbi:MAG: hypothetical protein LBC63_10710 [Holophagales bacterium]|jgi:hypothetical protein|nr:hypothetical protein [Holophagales bacterium]